MHSLAAEMRINAVDTVDASRLMSKIWVDISKPADRDPQVLSSHISSHLWARQSGMVRNAQRLKPLVADLSGTVRDGQKRS